MTTATPRTVVVTGGTAGIGRGIVQAFLDRGDRVVVIDVEVAGLGSLAGDDRLRAVQGSVAEETVWASVGDHLQGWKPISVLVNNAGISPKKDGVRLPVGQIGRDEWETVLSVNLTGCFLGMQAVIPGMREAGWGRIVNISSQAGRVGARVAGAHYGASKAGMLGLTRSAAYELGSCGITVNAVCPGRISTPMAAGVADEVNAGMLAQIPVGRWGEPSDIAAVVTFLASEQAGFVTGATVDSNGGSFMG